MIDAAQTFRQHEVLITGANGFVGKVLLGLLFERFPDLKHLHLLIRPRPGRPARERFDKDVLASPPLERLQAPPRISVHDGDVGQPDCGLAEPDLDALAGRVSLVLNCAGLVEFFPPVDESFRSNVDGVENVIALARRLGAKLLHVSTCFVCGESDGLVEESDKIPGFYPRRKGPHDRSFRHDREIRYMRDRIRDVYQTAASQPGAPDKETSQKLIDLGRQRAAQWGWVNTYTYAKSLGEQLIAAEPGLEWAIVRPAIVEAALEFPFPGWVEGGRTAAPLVMMAMSGLRHWPVRRDAPLEVVPVDQVASSILAAAALLLNGHGPRVYQIATADRNPALLGDIVEWLHSESHRRKPAGRRLVSFPGGVRILTASEAERRRRRLERRLTGLQHFVVGLKRLAQRTGLPGRRQLGALSVAMRTLGLRIQFREQTIELYQPFTLDNRFVFEAENIRRAQAMLSPEDRLRLPWTPDKIRWRDYWVNHEIQGIMKWVQPEIVKGRRVRV